tara:strand:+ start:247 stop:447 length:201 start_codon:yes stop_codon:yes gene_type:complete
MFNKLNVISFIVSAVFVSLPILYIITEHTALFDERPSIYLNVAIVWLPFYLVRGIISNNGFFEEDE